MKNKIFSKIIAIALCISVLLANMIFTVSVFAETSDTVIVVSGSDFQSDSSNESNTNVPTTVPSAIFTQIKADYPEIDGYLFAGDYSAKNSVEGSTRGLNVFKSLLENYYPNLDADEQIWIQGNHDDTTMVTDGTLAQSGANDKADYGVFVINEDDYPAYGQTSVVADTASSLESYLNQKVSEGYTKPIFIVSHVSLHYSYRTYTQGCAFYASVILDLLNDASNAGLNIIYMYGHTHNNGYDDYLGGDEVFFTAGDVINVPTSKQTWEEREINFTYLNAGYTAVYWAGYGSTSKWNTSMVVYEITENTVTFNRYGENGLLKLKDVGQSANPTEESGLAPYEPEINTVVYNSGYVLELNDTVNPTETITVLEEVNADNIITDGSADYIIVNNKTGTVLGTEATQSSNSLTVLPLGSQATVDSNPWTFTYVSSNVYTISSETITNLTPNNKNISEGTAQTSLLYVPENTSGAEGSGWVIYRYGDNRIKYTLQTYTYGGSTDIAYGYYANGSSDVTSITVDNISSIGEYSYWTLYQVVEVPVEQPEDQDLLADWTVITDITDIKEDNSYILVNKATGQVWSNDFSNSAFSLVDLNADSMENLWQFAEGLSGLSYVNADGSTTGFYQPNNGTISKASSRNISAVKYDVAAGGWYFGRFSSSGTYYFCADATNDTVTATSKLTAPNEYCYWIVYGLTSELPSDEDEEDVYDDPDTGANFTFAFSTDIHVGNNSSAIVNVRNMYKDFAELIEEGVELDTILISGDITQNSYQGEWDAALAAVEWYSPKGIKTYSTLGNHDARSYDYNDDGRPQDERWAEVWPRFAEFATETAGLELEVPYYHVEIEGHNGTAYDLVVLCTETAERDSSYISDTQLEWFEDTLNEIEAEKGTHQNIIVMCHQPIDGTIYSLSNSAYHVGDANDSIKDIIAEHPQVIYISGHIHTPYTNSSNVITNYGEGIYVDGIALIEYDDVYYRVVEIYDDYIKFRIRGANGTWLTDYDVIIDTSDIGDDNQGNTPEQPEDSFDGLQMVTTIEDSKSYVIVNKATGTAVSTTTATSSQFISNQTVLTMATPSADGPVWSFTADGTNKFKIQNENGKCLKPNHPNVTLEDSFSATVVYNEDADGWNIYRTSSSSATTYYLQTYYDETAQTYYTCGRSDGAAASEAACLWTIYEVTGGGGSDEDEVIVTTDIRVVDDETISSYAEYLVVNYATGTLLTDNFANSSLELGGEPSLEAEEFWTFEHYQTGSNYLRYYISSDGGTTYLKPNSNALSLDSSSKTGLYLFYDSTKNAWKIGRSSSNASSGYYFLTASTTEDGDYAYGYGGTVADGSDYWYLYEIVTTTTSNWQPSVIEVADEVEELSQITPYDIFPVIRTAAEFLDTATATPNNNVRFVEDTEQTTDALQVLRDATDERIDDIIYSDNLAIESGATVYYVSNSGSDSNSGTSPSAPWATLDKVNTISGSSSRETFVLFERGGLWRGQLKAKSYVTYSAYGTGDKPMLYASPFDGASGSYADDWTQHSTNIWKFQNDAFITEEGVQYGDPMGDIGTLIFNHGEACAIKIDDYGLSTINVNSMLDSDLEFYHDYTTGTVYVYSAQNPATRFDSIEFNVGKHIIDASSTNVTIDNLCVKYTGAHGIRSGSVNGFTIQNCEIGWIGGSIHAMDDDSYTRYGNGVEVWGANCVNFTVCGNYIYQIYDAGITQQYTPGTIGSDVSNENILYSGNVLEYCNYSIEYWMYSTQNNDSEILNFVIEDNYMWYAGRGLCEQRPDKTNACHINGWRTEGRNRAKNYVIRNNVMIDSYNYIFGIYSTAINSDGEYSMPTLNNNIILARSDTKLGVLAQGEIGDTSWPQNVPFSKDMFSRIEASLNGDIFGYIDSALYSGNALIIP